MWKFVKKSTVPFFVLVVGAVWKFPKKSLDLIGGVLDMLQLKELGDGLVNFLEKHPDIVSEIGPWALMSIAVFSLLVMHAGPWIYKVVRTKPIEVVFDPNDTLGRFASVGVWETFDQKQMILAFILRVGVRNNTKRTIYDVQGTIEGPFGIFMQPKTMRFSRTLKLKDDLHPESMELMDLMALIEAPQKWDIPDGVHAITIRIRAKDVAETVEKFIFDKSRVPPLMHGTPECLAVST